MSIKTAFQAAKSDENPCKCAKTESLGLYVSAVVSTEAPIQYFLFSSDTKQQLCPHLHNSLITFYATWQK